MHCGIFSPECLIRAMILRSSARSDLKIFPHGQNDIFTEYVDKLCAIFQRAQDRYGDITATIRYTDSEKIIYQII